LNVNILAKPLKIESQVKTSWFKLFKKHLFKNKYTIQNKKYNYYELKNNFKVYLKSFFNNHNTVSVFSDEALLGPMGKNNYLGLNNLYIFKEIITQIENELNIKIIVKFVITIRKQHSMILSTYYYDEEYNKSGSPAEIFKKIIKFEEYKSIFDYSILVKKIIKIFDAEILILPLELLEKDQKKYIDKFCKFINLDNKINIVKEMMHLNKNFTILDSRKRYFIRRIYYKRIFFYYQ